MQLGRNYTRKPTSNGSEVSINIYQTRNSDIPFLHRKAPLNVGHVCTKNMNFSFHSLSVTPRQNTCGKRLAYRAYIIDSAFAGCNH